MFAAVGGDAFRDGVFSHVDTYGPGRGYQSSVRQFNEGSLGAAARGLTNQSRHQVRRRRPLRGFGSSYQDGVLGDGSTIVIGPDGASIGPTPAPVVVPYYKRPEAIACAAVAVVAAYFLYKKR